MNNPNWLHFIRVLDSKLHIQAERSHGHSGGSRRLPVLSRHMTMLEATWIHVLQSSRNHRSPLWVIGGILALGLIAGRGAPAFATNPGLGGSTLPLPYRGFGGGASKGCASVLKTTVRDFVSIVASSGAPNTDIYPNECVPDRQM